MDFEAASESLDGGVRVVSVTGEGDLATGPELEARLGEPERAQGYPTGVAASFRRVLPHRLRPGTGSASEGGDDA